MIVLHHLFMLARDSTCGTSNGILPGLYDGLCSGGDVQITSIWDILIIVGNVVRILIAASGALAVIFIIIGGIYYITSAGDPAKIKRAKEIITQAAIGLVIVAVAYGVVTSIASAF